jgi:hypothetical protein
MCALLLYILNIRTQNARRLQLEYLYNVLQNINNNLCIFMSVFGETTITVYLRE